MTKKRAKNHQVKIKWYFITGHETKYKTAITQSAGICANVDMKVNEHVV